MPAREAKTPDRVLKLVLVFVFLAIIYFPLSVWWNQRQAHFLKESVTHFLEEENWGAAEVAARKWTEREPENSEAWLDLAEACRQQKKFAETADALGQISDKDPRILKSLALRTDLLLSELQDPVQAIENCQRILKIDPRADLARQRLIYINAMMLRRLEMVKQIRQAIKLQCEPPEAYVYLLLSDSLNFSNGAPLVNEWLKNDSGNEILEVALALYVASSSSQKSLPLANGEMISGGNATLITACLKKYPHNPEVLAYFLEKSLDQADLERVAQLLELVPEEAEADNRFWRFRGRYLALKNKLPMAEDSYRKALKRNPYDWRSQLGLSEIMRRSGKATEAQDLAQMGAKGKTFSRQLMELENPQQINSDLLSLIADYAQLCGDLAIHTAIQKRL